MKVRSVFVSFTFLFMLAFGISSVAFAEEATVAASSGVIPMTESDNEPFQIRDFSNSQKPGDPRNSQIELNAGRIKVRAFGATADNFVWKSDTPNIFKVEYGKSAGLANNSECYLIPTGGIGWGYITVQNGDKSMQFKIHVVKVPLSTEKYKFAAIPTCIYEGRPCTPSISITGNIYTATSNGMQQSLGQLKEGRDFKVEYKNNTKVGTATAVVTGIGNYEGTVSIPFTIKAAPSKPSNPSNSGSSSIDQSGMISDAGATTVKPKPLPQVPTVTGTWKKSSGKWWFSYDSATKKAQGNKSWPVNEWVVIKGKRYHFNSSGYMNSGWQSLSGTWYYFGSDGAMKTGWQKVKGKWYYLASDGVMQMGKKLIGNKIYFFTNSGAMKTGWNHETKGWFYYAATGVMKTGWQKVKGKWYYLSPISGVMLTGKQKIDGKTYFLNTSSGSMRTGWNKESTGWYYYTSSGAMKTGWLKSKNKWYRLDSSTGLMKTGFYNVGGDRYYSNNSGAMQTGWKKISGKWYYFKSSGSMRKNAWISGKYWVGEDGVMVTDAWVDNDRYYVGGNGAWVKGATR